MLVRAYFPIVILLTGIILCIACGSESPSETAPMELPTPTQRLMSDPGNDVATSRLGQRAPIPDPNGSIPDSLRQRLRAGEATPEDLELIRQQMSQLGGAGGRFRQSNRVSGEIIEITKDALRLETENNQSVIKLNKDTRVLEFREGTVPEMEGKSVALTAERDDKGELTAISMRESGEMGYPGNLSRSWSSTEQGGQRAQGRIPASESTVGNFIRLSGKVTEIREGTFTLEVDGKGSLNILFDKNISLVVSEELYIESLSVGMEVAAVLDLRPETETETKEGSLSASMIIVGASNGFMDQNAGRSWQRQPSVGQNQ